MSVITAAPNEITSLSDADLDARLGVCLLAMRDRLQEAACILVEKERRGHALPRSISPRLRTSLRRIAAGLLAPEAFLRFSGARVLQHVSELPVARQSELARGESVEVVEESGGGFDVRSLNPLDIPDHKLAQVFDSGQIRSVESQRVYLSQRRRPRDEWERDRAMIVKLTAQEERHVCQLAKAAKMTLAEYGRRALMGQAPESGKQPP